MNSHSHPQYSPQGAVDEPNLMDPQFGYNVKWIGEAMHFFNGQKQQDDVTPKLIGQTIKSPAFVCISINSRGLIFSAFVRNTISSGGFSCQSRQYRSAVPVLYKPCESGDFSPIEPVEEVVAAFALLGRKQVHPSGLVMF